MHHLGAAAVGDAHRHDELGPAVMPRKSGGSILAVARSEVVALARYSTVIAFGTHRRVVGTVGSISIPIAISAALHEAMACTVQRWLCTTNHFGTVTSANPGSIRTTCGSTDAKYGARAIAAAENSWLPPGRPAGRFHIHYVVVGDVVEVVTAGYLTLE